VNCPICKSFMTKIDVTPCYNCGHESIEIKNFKVYKNEYFLSKIYEEEIILCDFCVADFESYQADYFGVKNKSQVATVVNPIKKILNAEIKKDYYCKNVNIDWIL